MALRDIGADYECVGWSEIDKWAIKAHNAVFPELADRNYGDITKIDWNAVPNFDLFTYSFPCTDISSAGEQKGFNEDSGTRSSLLWECRRPIAAKRPKFLLMENVKALVSEKYRPLFLKWESWLIEVIIPPYPGAYYYTCFETEAYNHEDDPDYLKRRIPFWGWISCIPNRKVKHKR